jgi:hypothetical protein
MSSIYRWLFRLIIDKLSEEESQSCVSLYESGSSQPLKTDKSNTNWSNTDSQQDMDHERTSNVHELTIAKESISKSEEDGNISLLLCEETIPGSPAPENLVEASKGSTKSRSGRNLELPFASAPSISSEQSKESPMHKDVREREIMPIRNERELIANNNSVDTVMDNTPPTTPESSDGNISPARFV